MTPPPSRSRAAKAAPRRASSIRFGAVSGDRRVRSGRGVRPARRAWPSDAWLALPLMLAYVAAMAWGVETHRLASWVLLALPVLNLLTFMAYLKDKQQARHGQWRTRELTLHLWSALGGWPGAWCAQRLLAHKSRKPSFQRRYWLTVAIHGAALGAWLAWPMVAAEAAVGLGVMASLF